MNQKARKQLIRNAEHIIAALSGDDREVTLALGALQVFLDNNSEWISGVSEWSVLDGIDAGEGRAVCYPLNPAALGHATARLYSEEPPQANGLNIDVPCHASSGGTVIRFPVAFSYMKLGA